MAQLVGVRTPEKIQVGCLTHSQFWSTSFLLLLNKHWHLSCFLNYSLIFRPIFHLRMHKTPPEPLAVFKGWTPGERKEEGKGGRVGGSPPVFETWLPPLTSPPVVHCREKLCAADRSLDTAEVRSEGRNTH